MQELGFTAGELTPEDMQLMKEEKKRRVLFRKGGGGVEVKGRSGGDRF